MKKFYEITDYDFDMSPLLKTTHFDVCKSYKNDKYLVIKEETRMPGPSGAASLAIIRHDRKPIHDWRDLQEIKNQFYGKEREAIELYPAESRRIDTANIFWLWVLPAGAVYSDGFNGERSVCRGDMQRSFNTGSRNDLCGCGSGKKYKKCHWNA